MGIRFGLFLATFFAISFVKSQQLVPSIDSLRHHIYYLASDELKGRKTGEEGGKLAADYIKNRFQTYGLEPISGNSYSYPYQLMRTHKDYAVVTYKENILFWPWHLYMVSNYKQNDTLFNKLVFAGYGSDAELEQLQLNGKAIAFIADQPQEAYQVIKNIQNKYGTITFFVLFTKKNVRVDNAWSIDYKMYDYMLPSDFEKLKSIKITEPWASPPSGDSLNIFYCFPNVMRNVFDKTDAELETLAKDNKNQKGQLLPAFPEPEIEIFISYSDSLDIAAVENVGGFIKGKDTTQTIILSAHYDHLGEDYGQLYHGADDNASGTAALLENARLIALDAQQGRIPERNILFLAFSGEEMGLLGSKAFVSQPPFPLNQVVLNINMDMIGRWDEQHEMNKNFVYLLTAGHQSRKYFKLGKHGLNLPSGFTVSKNPGFNEKLTFKYGSDHYSFLSNKVPIAIFFTGLHYDYHTSSDIAEKINYPNLTIITGLVYQYITKVSNNKTSYPLPSHK